MFRYSEKCYTDVRIEDVNETRIEFLNGNIEDRRVRSYQGAFIRVFDGNRWYYCATADLKKIQEEIDKLVEMTN